ncbi:MAG TPA: hypothetical protein VHE80_08775, partial [Acidimicrobiales bacterium]|nr:hypothetical protein [Acidimicrobiales bacterium]
MSDNGDAVAAAAEGRPESGRERRIERRAAACFVISMLAAVALFFVYAEGGHVRAEGALLAVVLGGIGCGFVVWARGLLPGGGVEQHREELATPEEEREAFLADLEREGVVSRRKVLTRLLAMAGAALGAVAVFPVRSLGPGPGTSLKTTPWKKG